MEILSPPVQGSFKVNLTQFTYEKPCALVEVYRRFGRTYCLDPQARRVSQTRNQQKQTANMDGWRTEAQFGLNNLFLADKMTLEYIFSEIYFLLPLANHHSTIVPYSSVTP
jgi:hypothetical protein